MLQKNGKSAWSLIIWLIILIPVYYILYKIYIPKISAFGCFDDCFNYTGGYFLGKGKQLFSQIYFNHMPLMAYLSFLVQRFGNPVNIYALLLQHRQFLLAFGFFCNVFLCWRFGVVGLGYALIYELSKFYVFGDRFLAESFIVYPLVYLTGLGLHTILKKRIHDWEIILAAVCTWFVIFMREPYVPVSVFLFYVIMKPVFRKKIALFAGAVLLASTAGLFTFIPVRDFIQNVIILNAQRGVTNELQATNFFGTGIVQSFFYPVYLLVAGTWNEFRILLICMSVVLLASMVIWVNAKKNIMVPIYIFVALGLANLRPTIPGLQYYEAFHQMVWYALFIFSSLYVLREVPKLFYVSVFGLLIFELFSPKTFIYQRTNQHTEFINNYGTYLQVSEVIKAISGPNQTLFTNGADEFLYVASARTSPYPYSFYYPIQPHDTYHEAMMTMFVNNPPDIVYDFCPPDAPVHPYIPAQFLDVYMQWYSGGKPTCLYVKKTLVPALTKEQKAKAQEFLYYLPEK